MNDEMRMERASTGDYGYYFDNEPSEKLDDGDIIDMEYERDMEARFYNE